MSRITDEGLAKLMKALPRSDASSAFTSEVLKRLARPAQSRLARRRPLLAMVVAAAVILGGLSIVARVRQQSNRLQAVERIESLRTEYRELEAEVERLRSLSRELDPVLELSSTERVDFVFDLRELAKEGYRSGVRPVSHTSGEKQ